MENLKIRVANESESREAQELFFALGYSWNHRKGYYVIKYPNIIRSHSTGEMTQSLDSDVLYKKNREITLPELRYMVAFKKESLNDKVASAEAYRQAEELPFIDDEPIGQKYDNNKPRMSLLAKGFLKSVVNVMEFGAQKYDVDNWQNVQDAKTRYYDAMQRHIGAWWDGEIKDQETGEHHLAHAVCCAMFLMWFDGEKKNG